MWDIWVKTDLDWVIFETGVSGEEAAKIVTVLLIKHSFDEITIKENK